MDDPSDRRPLRKPDPDRVPQGDESAERDHVDARRDVSEGTENDAPVERSPADEAAERGLESRPSIFP